MGKHLVLAGAGHAHLKTLRRIDNFVARGHRVTVVSPSGHHYYSGMGPGLLGGTYHPREIRFNVRKMTEDRGGQFIEARVLSLTPERRVLHLASGEELPYDVVSFNTGSSVDLTHLKPSGEGIVAVKPIEHLLAARAAIQRKLLLRPLQLLVVGGGPAAVEIAGNLHRLVHTCRGAANLSLVAGTRLLATWPERARTLALNSLRQRGICVLEAIHVREIREGWAKLSNGHRLPFDFLFAATGISPTPLFSRSGLGTDPAGGLLVNRFLQSVSNPEIFGGGDCICYEPSPLAKVGVYAVRQNPILAHNLLGALEKTPLRAFSPQKEYLLILNLGNGRGILRRGNRTLEGPVVFRLKDWIDRRFMNRYQVSDERSGS